MDKSVLVENRTLVKFVRNYIRDSSGVFSISSLVRISMTSFPTFKLLFVQKYSCLYNKKKITRRPEDMNFSFSVISSMYNQYGNRGLFFVGSLYTVVCPPQEKHQLCLKRSERLRTSDSKKGKSRKERNYTALCSDVL